MPYIRNKSHMTTIRSGSCAGQDTATYISNLEKRVEYEWFDDYFLHLPPKFEHIFVAIITFFPLSSVQIPLLPACCLLYVL